MHIRVADTRELELDKQFACCGGRDRPIMSDLEAAGECCASRGENGGGLELGCCHCALYGLRIWPEINGLDGPGIIGIAG